MTTVIVWPTGDDTADCKHCGESEWKNNPLCPTCHRCLSWVVAGGLSGSCCICMPGEWAGMLFCKPQLMMIVHNVSPLIVVDALGVSGQRRGSSMSTVMSLEEWDEHPVGGAWWKRLRDLVEEARQNKAELIWLRRRFSESFPQERQEIVGYKPTVTITNTPASVMRLIENFYGYGPAEEAQPEYVMSVGLWERQAQPFEIEPFLFNTAMNAAKLQGAEYVRFRS